MNNIYILNPSPIWPKGHPYRFKSYASYDVETTATGLSLYDSTKTNPYIRNNESGEEKHGNKQRRKKWPQVGQRKETLLTEGCPIVHYRPILQTSKTGTKIKPEIITAPPSKHTCPKRKDTIARPNHGKYDFTMRTSGSITGSRRRRNAISRATKN